jgi:hypothetical protein
LYVRAVRLWRGWQRARKKAGPLSGNHPRRLLDYRAFKKPLKPPSGVRLFAALSFPECLVFTNPIRCIVREKYASTPSRRELLTPKGRSIAEIDQVRWGAEVRLQALKKQSRRSYARSWLKDDLPTTHVWLGGRNKRRCTRMASNSYDVTFSANTLAQSASRKAPC